jgi:hypothetical protein
MSTLTANVIKSTTIQHTNGTNSILMDTLGRLNFPNQPLFHAFGGAAQQGGGQAVVQFPTIGVNVGSNYNASTYRFTASITGNYFFTFSAMANSTTYNRFGLFKNGSLYGNQKFAANQTYERFSASWIVPLAVNDFVTIVSGINGNGEISVHGDYRDFTGFLLG